MVKETHRTGVTSDVTLGLAIAACRDCEWGCTQAFVRPTGEPVALRLVRIRANNHEQNPDGA
jgi:hypothetical protein